MPQETCPLCRRRVAHLLQHLVMVHRVKNVEEFRDLVRRKDNADRRASRFREFVEELKVRRVRNEITAEEYPEARRELA